MATSLGAAVLTPSLLIDADRLREDLTDVAERSRDLCWWSSRLAVATRPAWPIRGAAGDDVPLVTALGGSVTLCVDCLARKSGVPLGRVMPTMGRICETLRVDSGVALCDACLMARKVYRLA